MHRYVTMTTIAKVEKRRIIVGGTVGSVDPDSGQMKSGSLQYADDGWWIVTAGPSPISVKVGDTEPPHKVGDAARIVIEV